MKYKLNPFEENITKYDLYNLAEWIHRCKNKYQPSNSETPPEEAEKLPDNIKRFTSDWLEHQKQNKEFYESDNYRRALIASNYKRPKVYVRFEKHKVEISDIVYSDTMAFMGSLPTKNHKDFEEVLKNYMVETIDEYLALAEDIFTHPEEYKQYIDSFLKALHREGEINLNLKGLPKGTNISHLTKDELIALLKKQPTPTGTKIRPYAVKVKQKSFVSKFEDYEISKSTYFDWKKPSKEQRDYDKKFIACLGLMLGLPINEYETLMNYNGYCLAGSLRMFDDILLTSVNCGFPLLYIQVLIDKANEELFNKCKVAKISEIPNLLRFMAKAPKKSK